MEKTTIIGIVILLIIIIGGLFYTGTMNFNSLTGKVVDNQDYASIRINQVELYPALPYDYKKYCQQTDDYGWKLRIESERPITGGEKDPWNNGVGGPTECVVYVRQSGQEEKTYVSYEVNILNVYVNLAKEGQVQLCCYTNRDIEVCSSYFPTPTCKS